MNKYLKELLILVAIVAASLISYYLIIAGYPFDSEDRTETYFNCILLLKAIIASGAIIATSISLAITLKK